MLNFFTTLVRLQLNLTSQQRSFVKNTCFLFTLKTALCSTEKWPLSTKRGLYYKTLNMAIVLEIKDSEK